MLKLVFLLLFGFPAVTAVTHSLKYFYTASSGFPNFPEFVVVGLVDDVQMVRYDSNTKKAEPKQDWMNEAADPQYWERQTEGLAIAHQTHKANIEIAKQRFNKIGDVHINQFMYGCEWDNETGEVKGYFQYAYDGEDFVALDKEMQSWIAATPEAVITKHKWDNNKVEMSRRKNYLTQICPESVKKYVNYGRSSLMRTERPSVSLLQKTSSSPVSCHATGFYPNRAQMFWRKDGEEIHEDVYKGKILPNNDGTFQMTVHLIRDLPSDSSEDWTKYECVFQLYGDNDDIVTKGQVLSNEPKPNHMIVPITVALVVLAAVVVAAVVVILYKKDVFPY
ncbi:class I histocompatibility antigen, F10 alpha chain-like [Cololabis saira]|uniref:class I histocompatibility antigen, F10 alpha chain-like n=1 Tax=Cololabis saira TaxID=129043 RepID=UPI002AD4ADBF|nr:class I histocompatibility antigen, F10 alpha chain-like [Cololabis saira]